MEQDPWQVVRRALESGSPPDGQTIAALELLAERLEQIKRAYPSLAEVGFSPDVEALFSRLGHVHA